MMKKEDGHIDWSRPAPVLHNLVRGLSPWPGAFTHWNGQMLKLGRTLAEGGPAAEPGTVVSADGDGIRIACGEGVLRVRELQLAGKKKLPASDFLRGTSLSAGDRLGD
jgi:methionyl-tRNA formyltransferase